MFLGFFFSAVCLGHHLFIYYANGTLFNIQLEKLARAKRGKGS